MKLAFTTQGTDWASSMDPRFGRTQLFFVYDEGSEEIQIHDNSDIENEAHGAGPRTAQKLSGFDAQVLITGNGPGGNAARVLRSIGTEIYVGAGGMTVREAYDAYKRGELTKF
ncbi:MAG: NifB/NifX family molybdenum-iron cluster-binding protein [Xanthomonadales bacterium]|jgi:predicted Fe-Mo cluster-binding NifX family protein|nr:NifB/NifX family molybdenum-iron cluster-binding protein [Xanthomonadales bacterium]